MSLLLVHRTELIVWETNDESNDDPYKAMRRSTYSNSKSLVPSLNQIYGILWKKTEL